MTPLCCPSRATILTGRYAHNTGVRGNGAAAETRPNHDVSAPAQAGRVPDGNRGKFLNSWGLDRPPPFCDRFATGGSPYFEPEFNVNGTVKTLNGYGTTLVGEVARRFLRRFETNDAAPWLLYVAPHAPHHPWTPAGRHRFHPVGSWPGNPAVLESDRSDKLAYVRSVSYSLADAQSVRRGQLRTLMSVDDWSAASLRRFEDWERQEERSRSSSPTTASSGATTASVATGPAPGKSGFHTRLRSRSRSFYAGPDT